MTNTKELYTSGPFVYSLREGRARIERMDGPAFSVTLPIELDGHPVYDIALTAFWMSGLRHLIIPDGFTMPCLVGLAPDLRTVMLPDHTPDGLPVFLHHCHRMEGFIVGEGNHKLKTIDGVLFSRDGKILYAFPCGRDYDTYIVPDGVEVIGEGAFAGCTHLHRIILPEGLTEIGENAFGGCEALEEVVEPDSLEIIGRDAYSACTLLDSFEITAGVHTIGSGALGDCGPIAEMHVDPDNPYFVIEDGILYDREKTRVLRAAGDITRAILPETVREIDRCAFFGCESLEEVILPKELQTIGTEAFRYCLNLRRIEIPKKTSFWTYEEGDYSTLFGADESWLEAQGLTYDIEVIRV